MVSVHPRSVEGRQDFLLAGDVGDCHRSVRNHSPGGIELAVAWRQTALKGTGGTMGREGLTVDIPVVG